MLFIRRSLGAITAGLILLLALAGYTWLQDTYRVVADVVGVFIVGVLLFATFRIGK